MLILDQLLFPYNLGYFKFNLKLAKGDCVALIGASGAGKSTLLNLIAVFCKPASGKILIEGQDVTFLEPYKRPTTAMFQEHNLFPHLTVAQNVALGLRGNLKISSEEIILLNDTLQKLGLHGLNNRYPAQLSGGERQRVALARCILRKKPILLLDEPFTALDPTLRMDMLELLAKLRQDHNLTIIMATHYPYESQQICNKTALIFGDTIYKVAETSALLDDKQDPLIRDFLGKSKQKFDNYYARKD